MFTHKLFVAIHHCHLETWEINQSPNLNPGWIEGGTHNTQKIIHEANADPSLIARLCDIFLRPIPSDSWATTFCCRRSAVIVDSASPTFEAPSGPNDVLLLETAAELMAVVGCPPATVGGKAK